jgi:pyruvate dehydrogenase (quinone)
MNGMNELITVVRYWKEWSDPRLLFVVANNRDLNQVTWEMRVESGAPDFPGSQHLPDVSMAEYARFLGLAGIRVEDPADIASALAELLAADRPAVLEVVTDPNIAMLPPHILPAQAKSLASAILHGDPEAGPVIVESVKEVLAGVFPGRSKT